MAPTPGSFAAAAAAEIPKIFGDFIEGIGEGEGQFIRGGMPESITGKISQAAARSACRVYGSGAVDLSPGTSERYERSCRPYLDTLDPGNGPVFETPFFGGQCPANYRVRGDLKAQPFGANVDGINVGLVGPIGSFRVREQQPGNNTWNAEVFAQGRTNIPCGVVVEVAAKFYVIATTATAPGGRPTLENFMISPCGGALDNCGDPPPVVVPPVDQPDPEPPPFRFNPGPDIDIPINVDINPDGSISVDFGGGPTTVDPFPPDDPGGAGGGGDPGDPTDPGAPGGGGDTGAGGDTDGEAGPGEELVGVLVEILSAPMNANVFQNNSAQPFRGIGYVRMGYPGRLGVDTSASSVLGTQFFHAQQRGLTAWEVRANLGFSLRATPYYRDISE